MSSIIKFKVISGAFDDGGPLCYLLEIDDYKFLLDCGWNEACTTDVIEQYKQYKHPLVLLFLFYILNKLLHLNGFYRHIKSVDAILLSYPDVTHLGALPYLIAQLNLNCQIFSTIPIYKMGLMFMYDLCLVSLRNSN